MKKNLLITALFAVAISAMTYAQCVPDPQYTNAGMWPDPATEGIDTGTVGTPYVQVLTIVVPADTTIGPVTGTVNTSTVTGVVFSPTGSGLSTASPTSFVYAGGSTGCMEIIGTPAAAATYTVTISYTVNATIPPAGPMDFPAPDIIYNLVIEAGTPGAISEATLLDISELDILPNPSSEVAQVSFTSKSNQNVHFAMYNLIGEKLLDRVIESSAGQNEIDLDVSQFKSGIYFVSLSSDGSTVTKKLIVAGR